MVILLIEVALLAFFILYGLRRGGALGTGIYSMLALAIMVYVFREPLGNPPLTPVMIILAIGIGAGLLEAAGGLDLLVYYAGRLIQRFPKAITFVAPLIVFFFVFGVGTTNIALSLEPVIARTALKAKVRPERPLVASVLTANMALLTSPAASSAIVAATILGSAGLAYSTYLTIALISALVATLGLSLFMTFRGANLEKDPEYQRRLSAGLITEESTDLDERPVFTRAQKLSVVFFLAAVIVVLALGLFPDLVGMITSPIVSATGEQAFMKPSDTVQIMMFVAAALILTFTQAQAKQLMTSKIFLAAVGASITVLGPGWLGDTVFNAPHNAETLKSSVGELLNFAPWSIFIIMALVATFIMAQTPVIAIVFPLALALGVSPVLLVAQLQAVNVNYFIPALPTLLFAEEIDPTGSTNRFRAWLPGLVSTVLAILSGLAISPLFS